MVQTGFLPATKPPEAESMFDVRTSQLKLRSALSGLGVRDIVLAAARLNSAVLARSDIIKAVLESRGVAAGTSARDLLRLESDTTLRWLSDANVCTDFNTFDREEFINLIPVEFITLQLPSLRADHSEELFVSELQQIINIIAFELKNTIIGCEYNFSTDVDTTINVESTEIIVDSALTYRPVYSVSDVNRREINIEWFGRSAFHSDINTAIRYLIVCIARVIT